MESSGFPSCVQISAATYHEAMKEMTAAEEAAGAAALPAGEQMSAGLRVPGPAANSKGSGTQISLDAGSVPNPTGILTPGLSSTNFHHANSGIPDTIPEAPEGAQQGAPAGPVAVNSVNAPAALTAGVRISAYRPTPASSCSHTSRNSHNSSSHNSSRSRTPVFPGHGLLATPRISDVFDAAGGTGIPEDGPNSAGTGAARHSSGTAAAVKREFEFAPLGMRPIKGKGLLSTYLLKVRGCGAGQFHRDTTHWQDRACCGCIADIGCICRVTCALQQSATCCVAISVLSPYALAAVPGSVCLPCASGMPTIKLHVALMLC